MQRRELLTLCNRVNASQKVDDALALFEKNGELTGAKFERAIRSGIGKAQSLTNRNTLIFYWLLRERKAKDFCYDVNLSAEKARKLKAQYGGTEPILCESVEAERQHIVPYKSLKEVFNLEGRSRPGRHEVHDIANLTYISQGLNGYETGLGSHPLKLDFEPEGNLEAHLLRDPRSELLDCYNDVCSFVDSSSHERDFEKAKRCFLKFCKKRRVLITDAFLSWEKKIHDGIEAVPIGIRPAERLVYRQIDDMIRSFAFGIDVERALIRLLEMQGMVKARKQGADHSYGFRHKMSGEKKEQILRVDLYRSSRRIEIKLGSPKLRKWFRRVAPDIPVDEHHIALLDEMKPWGNEEVLGMICDKLRRIGQGDSSD